MLNVLLSFVMKTSDIKIITLEVKTDQLSHLVNGQANFYTQESHNVPEWTILILFTVVTITVRKKKTALANCPIYLTFIVSSGLAGRPGNIRLHWIHIPMISSTCGEVYLYTFAYIGKMKIKLILDQVDILAYFS